MLYPFEMIGAAFILCTIVLLMLPSKFKPEATADRSQIYTVSGGGPTATYTYYDDGSLKTIQWSPVAGTFTYNYTLNGQYNSIVFPNNQQRNYSFDDQGRLTQIVNTHPTPGNLATYSYGYDVDNATGLATMLGQRTSMNATVPSQSFNNHQTKYYYDGLSAYACGLSECCSI